MNLIKRLPPMMNAYIFSGLAVGFSVTALSIQLHPSVNYGEPEWIFITVIIRELLAWGTMTVKYYTGGVGDE